MKKRVNSKSVGRGSGRGSGRGFGKSSGRGFGKSSGKRVKRGKRGKRVKPAGVVLRPLGSGKYSDVFRAQTAPGGPSVVMKVSYYRDDTLCDVVKRLKAGDARGALAAKQRDAIQVSNAFTRFTAGLLDTVSPHFVAVFCEQDCSDFAAKLGPLLKDRLATLSPTQKKFNNVCFMELFDTNMTKFLVGGKYNEAALRCAVFQVLYTLAVLQRLLPGFRHNDLSTNNVLVKRLRRAPRLAYEFGGATYFVAAPLLVALSDYDFVHAPTRPDLHNERVTSGKFRVDGRPNDSYDTHFFLKSVLKCIQRRASDFPDTMAFLHRLRMRSEDRQNSSTMARLRPAALLGDAYFEPLKKPFDGPPEATYRPPEA